MMTLSDKHLTMLREGSSISDTVIEARGYRTITDVKELAALGFGPSQCRTAQIPGLLLPLHTTDGGNGLYVYRSDNPRVLEGQGKRNANGDRPCRPIKYEMPKNSVVSL